MEEAARARRLTRRRLCEGVAWCCLPVGNSACVRAVRARAREKHASIQGALHGEWNSALLREFILASQ